MAKEHKLNAKFFDAHREGKIAISICNGRLIA